jgi:hypothetical protein
MNLNPPSSNVILSYLHLQALAGAGNSGYFPSHILLYPQMNCLPTQEAAPCSSNSQRQNSHLEAFAVQEANPNSESKESMLSVDHIPPNFKLTFHSKVYILAEKCLIKDLKDVAIQKFKAAALQK